MIVFRSNKGFTLNELLIVVAITAILVIVAVPSFVAYLQRSRIVGTAQQLYDTLQFARSQAIKTNTNIFVYFQTGTNWCYGLNSGSTCNCAVANSCGLGTTSAPSTTSSTLSATGLSSSALRFEPNHGAANTNSSITFTSSDSASAITVKVGLLGSLMQCSTLDGYPACS